MLLSHSDDWETILEGLDECREKSHRETREMGLVGYGVCAFKRDGVKRPLEVIECTRPGLFYLGTRHEQKPYTRESVELFMFRSEAEAALADPTRWAQTTDSLI